MAVLSEDTLEIYVDGSSLSKPRRGGVGIRFVWVDPEGHPAHSDLDRPYSYDGARIGQMELRACIDALKELISRHPPVDPSDFGKVVIHTDSRYVADNYPNVQWGHWQKNNWETKEGTPVHNKPEWEGITAAPQTARSRLPHQARHRLDPGQVGRPHQGGRQDGKEGGLESPEGKEARPSARPAPSGVPTKHSVGR